jgi:hypothetical protein
LHSFCTPVLHCRSDHAATHTAPATREAPGEASPGPFQARAGRPGKAGGRASYPTRVACRGGKRICPDESARSTTRRWGARIPTDAPLPPSASPPPHHSPTCQPPSSHRATHRHTAPTHLPHTGASFRPAGGLRSSALALRDRLRGIHSTHCPRRGPKVRQQAAQLDVMTLAHGVWQGGRAVRRDSERPRLQPQRVARRQRAVLRGGWCRGAAERVTTEARLRSGMADKSGTPHPPTSPPPRLTRPRPLFCATM